MMVCTSTEVRHKCFQALLIGLGYIIQSTLDISNCQWTNKFVRYIESSTYRVVILCKFIRTGQRLFCSGHREFDLSRIQDIEIRL